MRTPVRPPVRFDELTQEQLHHAHLITAGLMALFSFRRVEWMFRCLRDGVALLHPNSCLTRNERIYLAATIVALRRYLGGEEAAERVISFLGGKNAIVQLLLWDTFRQELKRSLDERLDTPPVMVSAFRVSNTVH